MGKLVPDKLRKQFSIYVPFILKTFNRISAMGNGNHKLGHTSYSPFFVLGTAFLVQPFPFLSPHTSPSCPCLLAWICLVDPTSAIEIRRISSRSRGLVVMYCIFEQISITLGEVFSSQETLFPAFVVPTVMFMQDSSDGSVWNCCIHVDSLLNICERKRVIRSPRTLQSSDDLPTITNSCFSWSPQIFVVAVVYIQFNVLLHVPVESGIGILGITTVDFCNAQSYFIM